jgi:Pyridoxamine 5'-phosphate oxidase
MKLAENEALQKLAEHDHGVLCTVHPERGIDAVPVVYALDPYGFLGVPVDRVKPKESMRLQRQRNLEADPRATLLIEQWDRADWSQLWWVRAELTWHGDITSDRGDDLVARLAGKYPQYSDRPFAQLLVLRIVGISGWSARPTGTPVVHTGDV